MSDNEMTAEAMMIAARAETGLDDFGDDEFVEPLRQFLRSATTESHLSPEGLAGLQMDVARLLMNRLRHAADLAAHPEIADEDVSDPIVVVGIPRTGTTKLQRLMAADPSTQSGMLWRLLFPAPLPGPTSPDPRIALARQFQEQLAAASPEFMAVHTMKADEPEEEVMLAQMTFDRLGAFQWFYDTPSYHEFLADRPQDYVYGYVRGILQYLQWQDRGRRDRPWILKTPLHTGNIETLFSTFPNATVVHCHRDPAVALASFCSLVETFRTIRGHTAIDRVTLGEFLLGEVAGHWRCNLDQRDRLVEHKAKILDIDYADICADPIAVVRDIYAARGVELLDGSADAMLVWDRANPPGQYGTHRYSLAEYGLEEGRVREEFADYHRCFGG